MSAEEKLAVQAILAALKDLHSDLRSLITSLGQPIEQHENAIGTDQPTADQNNNPPRSVGVRAITQPSDAEIGHRQTNEQRTQTFQDRSLAVQWSLFVATFLAFAAAAWYAHIASQQKDTMD